jgi:hypothetical protein
MENKEVNEEKFNDRWCAPALYPLTTFAKHCIFSWSTSDTSSGGIQRS